MHSSPRAPIYTNFSLSSAKANEEGGQNDHWLEDNPHERFEEPDPRHALSKVRCWAVCRCAPNPLDDTALSSPWVGRRPMTTRNDTRPENRFQQALITRLRRRCRIRLA